VSPAGVDPARPGSLTAGSTGFSGACHGCCRSDSLNAPLAGRSGSARVGENQLVALEASTVASVPVPLAGPASPALPASLAAPAGNAPAAKAPAAKAPAEDGPPEEGPAEKAPADGEAPVEAPVDGEAPADGEAPVDGDEVALAARGGAPSGRQVVQGVKPSSRASSWVSSSVSRPSS
jgi:hypothetical protein